MPWCALPCHPDSPKLHWAASRSLTSTLTVQFWLAPVVPLPEQANLQPSLQQRCLLQTEVAAAEGALKRLGGCLQGIHPVDSFSEDGQRTALVVSKVRPTPANYPRQAGTPKRKPL